MTDRSAHAVVVPGHNRPHSLAKVLSCLGAARYAEPVDLIISIDGDHAGCLAVAEQFDWPWGRKEVRSVTPKLGLKGHIISCCDLASATYPTFTIIEDDLLVSPYWFEYTAKAAAVFAEDDRIGGIALYSYLIDEIQFVDFQPSQDGADNYFLQFACSWGQAWTRGQWAKFKAWFADNGDLEGAGRAVPDAITHWPASSWKKFFIHYLVDTGRYFVYPRFSLTSCPGVAGTNQKSIGALFETPLLQGPRTWTFADLDHSGSVYNAYFERVGSDVVKDVYDSRLRAGFLVNRYALGLKDALNILRICARQFAQRAAERMRTRK